MGNPAPSLERDLSQALQALGRECSRTSGLTGWLLSGSGTQHADIKTAIAAAEASLQQHVTHADSGEVAEVRGTVFTGAPGAHERPLTSSACTCPVPGSCSTIRACVRESPDGALQHGAGHTATHTGQRRPVSCEHSRAGDDTVSGGSHVVARGAYG